MGGMLFNSTTIGLIIGKNCTLAELIPSPIPDYYYTYRQGELEVPFKAFSDTLLCNLNISYTANE